MQLINDCHRAIGRKFISCINEYNLTKIEVF
mgnify:CR=1 FL=1